MKCLSIEILEAPDNEGRQELIDMAEEVFEHWLEMTKDNRTASDREELQVLLAAVQAACATRQ